MPAQTEPQSPTAWFRLADDLTNLRVPGSASFHMKIIFHALPGTDFAAPRQSPILTGLGTYDEIWLSPDRWRRQINFGPYHAVEVRADGVRKFQATSSYEPSRVLMLLDTVLNLIPRNFLSPEIEMAVPKWKLQRIADHGSQFVRLSFRRDSQYIPESSSWEFSLDGLPLRESSGGLITIWQNMQTFGRKWYPASISVRAEHHPLLAAQIAVTFPGDMYAAELQLPGSAADPSATLRPLHYYEVKPASILPTVLRVFSLAETTITGRAVIDRKGVPHEVEVLSHVYSSIGKDWVAAIRQERFTPAAIDGVPCEFVAHFIPPSSD